ncbi:hypothetical protein ACN27J_02970 [Solwaraspora sp. WMMB762]
MKLSRVAFAVALVAVLALAGVGGAAGPGGQSGSSPRGWPSCCGIEH